jgi:hypothetical protein
MGGIQDHHPGLILVQLGFSTLRDWPEEATPGYGPATGALTFCANAATKPDCNTVR